ncbi:nucloid associated Lsr2-like [Mycobacterium phage Kumao]|uniref:DNA binding protein n=1 Tax=Mycobacterium phage Kumao TaxID=2041344 RepID=A0A2D1GPL8_9CAUD|nr:nucloid associated Lsr2-like [Mycobacterium phage Kumao]ATN93967.1 DNA binding protein [Mycobacterium phage Kumao]
MPMARVTEIKYLDDFDNSLPADETVEIGWEGFTYVLDLTKANAKELRQTLKPWLEAAHDRHRTTKQSGSSKSPRGGQKVAQRGTQKEIRAAIREWARNNGYQVSQRGLISREVVDAYEQAHA